MNDTVLLITEDATVAAKVRDACRKLEAELALVANWKNAEEILTARIPHLVLCDYSTFEKLRKKWPRLCVLLYAEPADSEKAINAIKRGAIDYMVRPIASESLLGHVQDALRICRDIHVPAVYDQREEDAAVERIVGQSPAMSEVYKLIGLIAPRDVNVLVTGESGTGKELVARALLHHSPRKDKPYLAVNCAAIPETLLESELFGHEKGAFTGADHRRIGKFEQTNGGTLFLDEIGDIPLPTQSKLLRVLQDNTFQRLGGTSTVRSDVRIVAATNQDLESLIAEKRFRQDLYYRIRVASIHVPPLRDREVDAVLLAHHFVRRFNAAFETGIQRFSPEVLPVLLKYPWPGNVRELENTIKASLVVARGSVFRLEFLPENIRNEIETPTPSPQGGDSLAVDSSSRLLRTVAEKLLAQPALSGDLHRTATSMVERELIRACLERTNGRLAPAAKILGVSRTTLRKRMIQQGIQVKASTHINP